MIAIGKVPNTVSYNTEYYPIINLAGADVANEESQQNNWIPLRDTIYVKPALACTSFGSGTVKPTRPIGQWTRR